MAISIEVNGTRHELEVDPGTPLLWVLRDHLNMTGTKFGCGVAQCGACTVQIDGVATRSCVFPVSAAEGASISTIESLGSEDELHPLQQVWVDMNVPQCGYCQSGILMAASALLEQNPDPSSDDIRASVDNLCRCGTYPRVEAAIKRAAEMMRG